MLEKPALQDEKVIDCLQTAYGLPVSALAFLPLGADLNTAVYRAVTEAGTPYFVKLRWGIFDEISVALPKYLSDQGVRQIIAPLPAQTGQLWADLEACKVILYPFVAGRDGYEMDLSECHWYDFGKAIQRIHTTKAPPTLISRIQPETYSPQWREIVKNSLARLDNGFQPDEPVAQQTAALLKEKRAGILDLIQRAERLAQALQAQPPEMVICHSDLHAGNILIAADETLYIVDWDNPILAPKERDLMYAGGGQFGAARMAKEEEFLFYQGYGPTQVDPGALAYYRYERIVIDIAIYCEQLLFSSEGGKDREQSLEYLESNFLPNGTIEIAYQTDKTL